jgi:lipoyl(octanoyl) transferase
MILAAHNPVSRAARPVSGAAVEVKHLGRTRHADVWAAMRAFTASRDAATPDEIWLTEHYPVYTLGLAGKREHVLNPQGIPVTAIDRGGQVTYHGPGQVLAYLLIDLARRGIKVRELVARIEAAVLDTLLEYGVTGHRRTGMPGVYVNNAKIAALGLKVKNGCSYHGVSLNVAMDLAPFAGINPCGHEGLASAQLSDFARGVTVVEAGDRLATQLAGKIKEKFAENS